MEKLNFTFMTIQFKSKPFNNVYEINLIQILELYLYLYFLYK